MYTLALPMAVARNLAAWAACALLAGACSGVASGPSALASADADASASMAVDAKITDVPLVDALQDLAAGDGQTADAAAQDGVSSADSADAKKSGFNYECKPLTVESCVTACGSAGQRKCLKEWGPCIPPAEFCGNCADDNCNGLVNEGCAPNPLCGPSKQPCPVALIKVAEGAAVGTATLLHLSAAGSYGQGMAKVVQWNWAVQGPAGAAGQFQPSAQVAEPTFLADVAGQYLFQLEIADDKGVAGCAKALATVTAAASPAVAPSVGCADGTREGFVDQAAFPQIAGCSGAWDKPGITPDGLAATCANQGGNSGPKASGSGCSAVDLCAAGWHICKTWQDVAQKSPSGCAGATPADAKPKSLFFALRQPSADGSVCGSWGDGFNDVFGCGNLGTALEPQKNCGPLDRVLASTQVQSCGFNEAEPNLGPWQCLGAGKTHLNEGANVTKKACQNNSCQYDGVPLGPSDKGGVLCCHD